MPLQERTATHFRASCDGCRHDHQTAEVCAKRDSGKVGKAIAVEKLRAAGWHVDGLDTQRERWYCRSCAKRPHL